MSSEYFTVANAYEQNKDLKKQDVLLLQEWLAKQPHLPKFTEIQLIIFLHACYYKIEATKTCVDNFATLKAHWPEFALNRNVFSSDMERSFQALLATVLPRSNNPKYMVVYGALFDKNSEMFEYNNFMKAFDMILSLWLRIVGTSEGHILVMDVEGFSFAHILKLNIMGLKKYMYYLQDALPWRLKALHVIHLSPAFFKLFSLLKPFIKEDLMKIIHLNSEIELLYEDVPKISLPNELGGEAGTFQELHDQQMELLKENAEYLLDGEKEVADESKRQEKSKFYDDVFGIDGTFKKLDID